MAALGPASLGLLLERVAQARQAGPQSAAAAPLDAAFFAVAIGVCTTAKQVSSQGRTAQNSRDRVPHPRAALSGPPPVDWRPSVGPATKALLVLHPSFPVGVPWILCM